MASPRSRRPGPNARNLITARAMLEHCRFAYKAYAQTCKYQLDPFFESDGAGPRDDVMDIVHRALGTAGTRASKFDPVEYDLDTTPDPSKGTVYRDRIAGNYVLFQPRAVDKSIGYARGFDLAGAPVDGGTTIAPSLPGRCGYFQGMTGMTGDDPEAGWRSWLGAVVHAPAERAAVIVFRGSRSGSANRAVLQAQLEAKGSADWVTDMQHFHPSPAIAAYDDAFLSVGFHLAYESCRRSLSAALEEATGGERPETIYLTGHSLGGALAQCAYLDMTMGDLAPLVEGATIACYPISAPPVLLGQESHWKLALAVDATQIFHYFCRHDAVHGGSIIRASGVARINDLMAATASPLHLGVEVALESEREFPEAHEPESVFRGMNGGASDPGFWPLFRLEHLAHAGPLITGLPSGMERALVASFRDGLRREGVEERVERWLAVLGDAGRDARAAQAVRGDLARTIELVHGPSGGDDLEGLEAHRKALVARYEDAGRGGRIGYGSAGLLGRDDYRATASCYWSMLQYLTAHVFGRTMDKQG
ncbi:MAG: hypothetical protein U0359_14485 [Byssovorax sp.]